MELSVVHRVRTLETRVQVCAKCELELPLDEPAEEGDRVGLKYVDALRYANGEDPIVVYVLKRGRPLSPAEYLCHGDRIVALTRRP